MVVFHMLPKILFSHIATPYAILHNLIGYYVAVSIAAVYLASTTISPISSAWRVESMETEARKLALETELRVVPAIPRHGFYGPYDLPLTDQNPLCLGSASPALLLMSVLMRTEVMENAGMTGLSIHPEDPQSIEYILKSPLIIHNITFDTLNVAEFSLSAHPCDPTGRRPNKCGSSDSIDVVLSQHIKDGEKAHARFLTDCPVDRLLIHLVAGEPGVMSVANPTFGVITPPGPLYL